MSQPINEVGPVGSAWGDLRKNWAALLSFEVAFKLLEAWLFVPAVAALLAVVMARAGHVAVTNRDLLDFLLTPLGLLYAAVVAVAAAALFLVEQAGIMVLADRGAGPASPGGKRGVLAATARVVRVARLGAAKVILLTLTLLPFVLAALLTYAALLSRHDINYYLADRPPAFWLAAAVGGLIAVGALTLGVVLYVRWAFALPILLFEDRSARDALRESRARVRGAGLRVGAILIGWQVGVLVFGAALLAGFRYGAAAVLDRFGDGTPVLVLLLAVQGVLLAGVSFAAVVGQALLARRLYLARSGQLGLRTRGDEPAAGRDRRLALVALAVLAATPLVAWVGLARVLDDRAPVRVTAHRGHAHVAPENTLAAVRKAIESGADYAEVDVQLTSDGAVVLLHDRDLKRVTGDPRRIEDVPLAELRKLDAGGWFAPAFAGERVPTLEEVIDLARGRIKLNIELKFYGPDRRLAREVARVVTERGFVADCLVTSFEHGALLDVKGFNPAIRTGLIVAAAVGDVTGLEGDALSVRADGLTDDVLRRAHRRGQEVHAWTVNDERQAVRLVKRGVDNIITSDPDLLVRVRDDWESRTGAERLVAASRVLLGIDP